MRTPCISAACSKSKRASPPRITANSCAITPLILHKVKPKELLLQKCSRSSLSFMCRLSQVIVCALLWLHLRNNIRHLQSGFNANFHELNKFIIGDTIIVQLDVAVRASMFYIPLTRFFIASPACAPFYRIKDKTARFGINQTGRLKDYSLLSSLTGANRIK